jgi:hypothetical protein
LARLARRSLPIGIWREITVLSNDGFDATRIYDKVLAFLYNLELCCQAIRWAIFLGSILDPRHAEQTKTSATTSFCLYTCLRGVGLKLGFGAIKLLIAIKLSSKTCNPSRMPTWEVMDA